MNEILKSKTISKNNKNENSERIYFPELDGLRFFAFLLVFIHHNSLFAHIPLLSILQSNGWIGVDLFFVLSAYLFTKLLIAENKKSKTISFRKFYIRRIFRIWPIYFLMIAFAVFFYTFQQHETISKYIGIRIIGLSTFTDNILTAIRDYNPIPFTEHLWTISYEEQFYIFIPLIIFLLVRSSFKTKVFCFISTVILLNAIRFLLIANKVPHPAIWVLPITHFESIIMGIVIGFGGINFLLKSINPLIIAFVGILCFILLSRLPDISYISYWLTLSYSLVGISTSLILYSVIKSKHLRELFSKKIFVFLGKRSYGLYVYHLLGNFVAGVAIRHILILPPNSLTSFLISLSFTILISIASYEFIEKPFLILKKKFEIITSRPV